MPGIGNDIKKPGQDEIGYDRTPLKALASQLTMWKDVRADLAEGHPAAAAVPVRRGPRRRRDLGADHPRRACPRRSPSCVALTDSFHVATLDNDAPLIFERVAAFIAEHVGAPHE